LWENRDIYLKQQQQQQNSDSQFIQNDAALSNTTLRTTPVAFGNKLAEISK